MAETSAIQWTDATVNFWWGCTKVGPGCDHCYAETWNNFRGNKMWGTGAPRRPIKGAAALIRKLQRQAPEFFAEHGRRRRVFMQSMSDTFDNEVEQAWRVEMFAEIEEAPDLEIQLLTKRIGNVPKMVPVHWAHGLWPRHVGLMATVVNQAEFDRDVPKLLATNWNYGIPWVGLSIEPMLGPIKIGEVRLDWIIAGGESGAEARPSHPHWFTSLRDQCAANGTPFLFKQWGEWLPARRSTPTVVWGDGTVDHDGSHHGNANANGPGYNVERVGKKTAGRLLDGIEHNGFPKIRQSRIAA